VRSEPLHIRAAEYLSHPDTPLAGRHERRLMQDMATPAEAAGYTRTEAGGFHMGDAISWGHGNRATPGLRKLPISTESRAAWVPHSALPTAGPHRDPIHRSWANITESVVIWQPACPKQLAPPKRHRPASAGMAPTRQPSARPPCDATGGGVETRLHHAISQTVSSRASRPSSAACHCTASTPCTSKQSSGPITRSTRLDLLIEEQRSSSAFQDEMKRLQDQQARARLARGDRQRRILFG